MFLLKRPSSAALTLAERLCRPQRIGIFGHRGVGKTTLVTMLYREAVAGRLPALRLAAADTRTAEYLSDKVLQLESGQPLPATLAETDLRFHLYRGESRLELLLKDYQGEHLELGRHEAIHDFLHDCDAVWLCLDVSTLTSPAERLRRQQEIEQLAEDYLAGEAGRRMDRPIALVLTKADLLGQIPEDADELARTHFGMTRHFLGSHCKNNALFAVSSLGSAAGAAELQPIHLADPLTWLATALQLQDEARLEQIETLAPEQVTLLERCVGCFARRYADAPATAAYRAKLRELRQRRRRRRILSAAAAIAVVTAGLWTYDAVAYQETVRFEADHAGDPAATLQSWQQYQKWHPTRHLFSSAPVEAESDHVRELAQRTHDRERDERLVELRRRSADPDADAEVVWQQFQEFRAAYPELDVAGDVERVRAVVKARRDEEVEQRAHRAYDELARAGQRSTDLADLVVRSDRFLRDYPGSSLGTEVRALRAAALRRLDDQDIRAARDYSARHPLNFHTRRELYQGYLDRHPGGAGFTDEAKTAIRSIDETWDRSDFRRLRDHFVANPGDVAELVNLSRRYLAVHPKGKFAGASADILRWTERVTVPGEYRVVLKSGTFDNNIGRWFTKGPKLSVEIEVAGVRYGPSSIVRNKYDPEWDFEYPRRVRWKLGDPVVIRVTDHNWKDRVVVEYASAGDDRLAMRMLSGDNAQGPHRVTFWSDFAVPKLPKIE